MASKRARTFNFFFTSLLGAFEFAGEQIIHDKSSDVRGDLQTLLWWSLSFNVEIPVRRNDQIKRISNLLTRYFFSFVHCPTEASSFCNRSRF